MEVNSKRTKENKKELLSFVVDSLNNTPFALYRNRQALKIFLAKFFIGQIIVLKKLAK